jgi:hypothetical protein
MLYEEPYLRRRFGETYEGTQTVGRWIPRYRSRFTIRVTTGRPIMTRLLEGKVALVAGATRGAGRGIAINLVRQERLSTARVAVRAQPEINRPETIEETAELVKAALQSGAEGRGSRQESHGKGFQFKLIISIRGK